MFDMDHARLWLFLTACYFITPGASAVAQNASEGTLQTQEFRGTVVPARTAEISPRYNGLLLKIDFIPGQFVEQGDYGPPNLL